MIQETTHAPGRETVQQSLLKLVNSIQSGPHYCLSPGLVDCLCV